MQVKRIIFFKHEENFLLFQKNTINIFFLNYNLESFLIFEKTFCLFVLLFTNKLLIFHKLTYLPFLEY